MSTPLRAVEVIPTSAILGAEVRGLDLSQPLSDSEIAQVHRALLDHCVVFFRNQRISEEQQVRFTSYFGRPEVHVRAQPDRPVKAIFIVSNVQVDGRPIGALGNDELPFHSDLSYLEKPGTYSLLYAVEVPRTGGATQWLNAYAAYDALDNETKKRLAGLRAVHRHYVESQNPPQLVTHPIVRVHPGTGRKCLYIGPQMTRSIVGLDE